MRCPYCDSEEDKVVDSRLAEEGRAIRRRRGCIGCGRRYTTFERAEEVPLLIAKRSGEEEPFDRDKVIEGIHRACKNRPVSDADILAIADDVEEAMRADGAPADSLGGGGSRSARASSPHRRGRLSSFRLGLQGLPGAK